MSESQTRKQNILYPDSDIPLAIVLYIVLLKQQYAGWVQRLLGHSALQLERKNNLIGVHFVFKDKNRNFLRDFNLLEIFPRNSPCLQNLSSSWVNPMS